MAVPHAAATDYALSLWKCNRHVRIGNMLRVRAKERGAVISGGRRGIKH